MDISQMVNQGYSLEAIQSEINKCEVVAEIVILGLKNKDGVQSIFNVKAEANNQGGLPVQMGKKK